MHHPSLERVMWLMIFRASVSSGSVLEGNVMGGKRRIPSLLFVAVIQGMVCLAGTAQAATEYRCLSDCLSLGNPGRSCLQSCDYVAQGEVAKPSQPRSSNHSVFTLSQPVTNVVILPTAPVTSMPILKPMNLQGVSAVAGPSAGSYYVCKAQCQQNKYEADYCAQSCAR